MRIIIYTGLGLLISAIWLTENGTIASHLGLTGIIIFLVGVFEGFISLDKKK